MTLAWQGSLLQYYRPRHEQTAACPSQAGIPQWWIFDISAVSLTGNGYNSHWLHLAYTGITLIPSWAGTPWGINQSALCSEFTLSLNVSNFRQLFSMVCIMSAAVCHLKSLRLIWCFFVELVAELREAGVSVQYLPLPNEQVVCLLSCSTSFLPFSCQVGSGGLIFSSLLFVAEHWLLPDWTGPPRQAYRVQSMPYWCQSCGCFRSWIGCPPKRLGIVAAAHVCL